MAAMGQTAAPTEDEMPDLHFVAIIGKNGKVWHGAVRVGTVEDDPV